MENDKTVLTFESNGNKIIYEMPWCVGMEELLDAFYSGCIGITFAPETILKNMKEYAEEKLEAYGWNNED